MNLYDKENISFDDVCTLIGITETRGSKGERIETRSETGLYCTRKHINQSEFFKAHQEGLRSDLCLIIHYDEYSGENIVAYNDKQYSVYRVYERGDGMAELYCSERAGVNGTVN